MSDQIATIDQVSIVLADALPLDQNPAAVYLAALESEASRRVQRDALDTIAGKVAGVDAFNLAWGELRKPHVVAIKTWLAGEYKPATANRMLSALRRVLEEAADLDQMSARDYQKIVKALKGSVKGETLPPGRALTPGEIDALLTACLEDRPPLRERDAALLAVLRATGLRRAELVGLDLGDYRRGTADLMVRKGKGRKERKVPLTMQGAVEYLADWLAIRGDEPGALFWPALPSGFVRPGRLTAQTVYDVLKKRAGQAGVEDVSPHDFRRTLIGDLLDAGVDTITVSQIVGHESPDTTKRYDRRPGETRRKALARLHLPYRGKRAATVQAHLFC